MADENPEDAVDLASSAVEDGGCVVECHREDEVADAEGAAEGGPVWLALDNEVEAEALEDEVEGGEFEFFKPLSPEAGAGVCFEVGEMFALVGVGEFFFKRKEEEADADDAEAKAGGDGEGGEFLDVEAVGEVLGGAVPFGGDEFLEEVGFDLWSEVDSKVEQAGEDEERGEDVDDEPVFCESLVHSVRLTKK